MQPIFLSVDAPATELEVITERKPDKIEIMTEEETQKPKQKEEPHNIPKLRMSYVCIINTENQSYILGSGWIKDDSGRLKGNNGWYS